MKPGPLKTCLVHGPYMSRAGLDSAKLSYPALFHDANFKTDLPWYIFALILVDESGLDQQEQVRVPFLDLWAPRCCCLSKDSGARLAHPHTLHTRPVVAQLSLSLSVGFFRAYVSLSKCEEPRVETSANPSGYF